MHPETRDRLCEVTRTFYERSGDAFADTRQRPWAGWARVAASLGGGARVLDLGCGHGRFADYLQRLDPARRPDAYLGVDQSLALLARARARALPSWVRFAQADILRSETLADVVQSTGDHPAGHDLVALFGVLHHIPGQVARKAMLARALSQVAPGGLLAVTLWRFDESPRFASVVLPESAFGRLGVSGDREPGDCLLRFGTQPDSPARYCHFPTRPQRADYLALDGAQLVADYRPDWGDTFNQYLLFRAHP